MITLQGISIVNDAKAKLEVIMIGYLPDEIIRKCIEHIQNNDPAHDVDHVFGVVQNAQFFLANQEVLKVTPAEAWMVVVAAFMHDIGSGIDREHHHVVGARMALDYLEGVVGRSYPADTTRAISMNAVYRVANAILQHRASYKGVRIDPVADLVALADRGRMNNPIPMFVRACIAAHGKTCQSFGLDTFNKAFSHAVYKFGPNGYAWRTFPEVGTTLLKHNIDILKETFTETNQGSFTKQCKEMGMVDFEGKEWKYLRDAMVFYKVE